MAKKTEDVHDTTDQKPVSFGVVFELEELAFPGRRMIFETLSSVLKEKKIQLTPVLFSRYCLRRSVDQNLTALLNALDKRKLSVEKLTKAVNEQFNRSLAKASLAVDPFLGTILSEAKKEDAVTGALSALPSESALSVMTRLGLDESVELQVFQNTSENFPTPDCWLNLAKTLGLHPRQCVALVTCATSCRSALAAGMRCVAIPDEFTVFQDFGGADIFVEGGEKLGLKKLMSLLHTCSFR